MSVLTSDPSVKHEESTWILKSGVDLRIVVFAYAATGSKQTNLGRRVHAATRKVIAGIRVQYCLWMIVSCGYILAIIILYNIRTVVMLACEK